MEHVKTYFNNLISNSPLITIPIITCFGYLFAYQYELGTARYYNIPENLVQLDLLQVIYYAVVIYIFVFILGVCVFLIISTLHPLLSRFNPNKKFKTKSEIITSRIWVTLLALLLLIIFPKLLGQQWASERQAYFLFEKNNMEYAIVKIYGDSIIAMVFDEKRRILKNDILLLPKDQSINGTVKYFEKLKVEK